MLISCKVVTKGCSKQKGKNSTYGMEEVLAP